MRTTGIEVANPVDPPLFTSTLPFATRDGQVVDFLADAAKGVVWRFRSRKSSPSYYKWEFVGGPPLAAPEGGDLTTASTTQVALSGGPSLSIPFTGEYVIEGSAYVVPQGVSYQSGYNVVELYTGPLGSLAKLSMLFLNGGGKLGSRNQPVLLTKGQVLSCQVYNPNGNSCRYLSVSMAITPIRVTAALA